MSRYSGKADVYDHFWMSANTEADVEKEIQRTDFYIYTKNGRRHKLAINNLKDLAPYYPYLISVGVWSKEGRCTIVFSNESFVDQEEREFMSWELRDALAEYKRCKRKKIPFDVEEYMIKRKNSWHSESNYTREIVNRVAKDGLKANLDGLYSIVKDKWDRVPLAKELKRLGHNDFFINTWVFGYRNEEDYPDWGNKED